MKRLDLTNALHIFTPTNNTFTASEDCYIMGQLWSEDQVYATLQINNNIITSQYVCRATSYAAPFIPQYPLKAGDVVKVTNFASTAVGANERRMLKIFK